MKKFLYNSIVFLLLCCFTGCAKKNVTHKKEAIILVDEQNEYKSQLIQQHKLKTKKQKNKLKQKVTQKQKTATLQDKKYKDIQAELVGIPTPLHVKCVSAFVDLQGVYKIVYQIPLELKDVETFYSTEMQRSGWQQEFYFFNNDDEVLMTFKKDVSYSVIVLKTYKNTLLSFFKKQNKTHIFLYVL